MVKATTVNAGLAESNGRLLLGIWRDSLHVTCGLTACTPGSAPGPTPGNEYGKTLPFYLFYVLVSVSSSNWQSSSTELCTAQHPAISLKNCAMSLICRWVRGRLRSSTSSLLDVRPSRRATVATAACPSIWNSLPDDVTSATSLLTYRQKLKARLFRQSYPDIILRLSLSFATVHLAVFLRPTYSTINSL